jgi:hypothetical protein
MLLERVSVGRVHAVVTVAAASKTGIIKERILFEYFSIRERLKLFKTEIW